MAPTLSKSPRPNQTGAGNACCHLARKTIPRLDAANERAGDATTATAALLATLARAFETVEGGSGSNGADSASVTSSGANHRDDKDQRGAPRDSTACCCDDQDPCSTEPGSASYGGKDDAAKAIGVTIRPAERVRACSRGDVAAMASGLGINLGERDREDMVYI